MYIIYEYAACMLAVFAVATLVFGVCAMYILLTEGCGILAQASRKLMHGTIQPKGGRMAAESPHPQPWFASLAEVQLRALQSFRAAMRTREVRIFTIGNLVALFFLVILAGVARPQESSTSPCRRGDEYTIRVNAEAVVLHATVQDRRGVLVSGLSKEDFQVYEDGVLQQISSFSHEDVPVTVGLVVDNSGSMKTRRSEVIAGALAFARSSNPEDEMFVVIFNENVSFGLSADTPFTDDVGQLRVALSRIAADGMTALYDAVAAALEHLKKGRRDKKVLIVISDGDDNASQHNLDQIVTMAEQSDAIIYTMGLFVEGDHTRNPRPLRRLARATGGEAFLPASIKEVAPIFEQIAHDIRNQYTIFYVPTNRKQDGAYRAIQVKAGARKNERLFVRTRAGYYAHLEPHPAPEASHRP
jgi:VWFA-related protein